MNKTAIPTGNITDQQENDTTAVKKDDGGDGIRIIMESPSLEDFLNILHKKIPSIWPLAPSIAVCMPNTCSQSDVQQILVNGLNIVYTSASGKNSSMNPAILPWPVTEQCTDMNKPPFGVGSILVIIILTTLVTLSLVSGVIDYWQQTNNQVASESENCTIATIKPSSTLFKCLMAFSLYTNLRKLLSTKKSANDLGCIHGIRFFSTAWIVLEHACVLFLMGHQWNLISLNNIYKDWTTMPVANGTFSVDTFFVMSGALVTYNILKMLDKSQGKFDLIMFYVHRYMRISPAHFIILGIAATLLPYTGNGPQWHIWNVNTENCQKRWWVTFLYVNNLVHADAMCNDDSWYLANDMQFYFLSPLFVYPIWKWKSKGLLLLGIYSVISCVIPAVVLHFHPNNPPAMILHATTHNEIYHRPWSRISAFLAGVWLGYLLHKTRGKRVNISRPLNFACWLLSAATALSIIFGVFPWFNPAYKIPKISGYFYAGLSRFFWGVSISWVIFACVNGYGGIVNKFLSWKAFMPLGRLSFCVYLLNFHLQSVFHLRLTVPIKWDLYTMINLFFAHMVMSYLLGAVCTLLFESPFIILQKLLFDQREGAKEDGPKRGDNSLLPDVEMTSVKASDGGTGNK